VERVEKDELFQEPDPRVGETFTVGELTAGYRYDFLKREHSAFGLGASGTVSQVPSELRDTYGDAPFSVLAFLHAALR
jgi:hypothetical protein